MESFEGLGPEPSCEEQCGREGAARHSLKLRNWSVGSCRSLNRPSGVLNVEHEGFRNSPMEVLQIFLMTIQGENTPPRKSGIVNRVLES